MTGTPAESAPRPAVPWRRELAGGLLAYLMLALIFTWDAWKQPWDRWIGHCCDQQQFMWFLAWSPTALELGQNPLLTDRLNAPDGANLMWNAAIPLIALLFAPLTRTEGPVFAYNVVALLGIAFSGLAAFAALRRYSRGALGPLVGGALYAFSPFVASHAALHLNLINVWAPPLFLLILDELVVRRRYRPEALGAALGVIGAIQLVTFEEVLATSAIAGLLLVVVMAIVVYQREPILESLRRMLRAVLPGLATFLALGAFPLWVQFFGPQQVHDQVQPATVFSTNLLNLILPTDYTLIAPEAATEISRRFSGLRHEATGYIGIPMLLVLGWITVDRRRDPVVVTAAVMVVALFLLSLGPQLHVGDDIVDPLVLLPWEPFASLPLIEHALPGRLTLYMYLAMAVMLAVAVDRAAGLARRPAAARLVVIGLALVFLVPRPASSTASRVPAFFTTWEEQGIAESEIILFAPWFTNGAGADPMLWAAFAEARPRMREGYVYVPDAEGRPRYGPPAGRLGSLMIEVQDHGTRPDLTADVRATAIQELRDIGITTVIIGPLRYRTEMIELFTSLLGRPPIEVDGVQLWRGVQELVAAG